MNESHMGHLSRPSLIFFLLLVTVFNDREVNVIVDVNVFYSGLVSPLDLRRCRQSKVERSRIIIESPICLEILNTRIPHQRRIASQRGWNPLFLGVPARRGQPGSVYADIARRGVPLSRIEATPRRMFSQPFSCKRWKRS